MRHLFGKVSSFRAILFGYSIKKSEMSYNYIMKIEKSYFVLCENHVIDEKKRVSLINIYDVIFSSKVPALHPRLLYVASISISKLTERLDSKFLLTLKMPNGEELISVESDVIKIDNIGSLRTVNGIFDLKMVPLSEYGVYEAYLSFDGKKIAEHRFELKPSPKEKI